MLTTLGNVKQWLNLTTPDDDALLTRLIEAASAFVEGWVGRTLRLQTYSEERTGSGQHRLLLAHYPPCELYAVTVAGQHLPPGEVFTQGRWLNRRSGVFARGCPVQLRYSAGYASIPPDIEQAVIDLVALRYRERDRIGHQSKSLAGETVTFFIGELSPAARAVLIRYRDVVPL